MPLLLALALLQSAQQPAPRRAVPDPGVIATDQRVTPAGVQSVFDGRLGAVRFGESSSDIWVSVEGGTYHMDWRANRVLARAAMSRPGVHGIVIDRITHRALVSSVSRIPDGLAVSRFPGGAPLPKRGIVTQLYALGADATGDSITGAWRSMPLGMYMAGAPAVARTKSNDGHRYAVLPLPADDELAVLDADDGSVVRMVKLGVEPIAAAISDDGATAWVSILGGHQPDSTERSSKQCCDPRAESVRVDTRGIAEPGSVSRVDVLTGEVTADVRVGRHPTALVWDAARGLAYVADGNSDSVSVIDTRSSRIASTLAVAPFSERTPGVAPTALALSPDGTRLYVALGGANAVAVYDVSRMGPPVDDIRLLGLVPTAWYPNALDVSADGKFLAVGALLGVGSGTRTVHGLTGRYVHAVRSAVNVLPVPTDAELSAYTTAVAQNNRLTPAGAPEPRLAARATPQPQAVPERPGDPSLINHVVFIVRENRTYDQILGDLGRGDGDSSLTMYGEDVTPNAHALARQFVTLDHFFASGGNSADGHQWLTQANETDYPMWPLYYGRSYPYNDTDAMTYSAGGFLWENAESHGKRVRVFGEYADEPGREHKTTRDSLLDLWRRAPDDFGAHRAAMAARYHTVSSIPSLDRVLVRDYPGWSQEIPDVIKAGDILAHLADWEQAGDMPALTMIVLPNDHTQGTSPGWCAPKACVADNDLALGMLVQGLSHSSFWKDMAILIVEDDAQDGVDHIDGHRTVALVASPYARRDVVDSTFYAQTGMVRTIELMLGLPAMSMFDLVATDMRASFIGLGDQPDYTPYTAVVPRQSLYERNVRVGGIRGPHAAERRRAAIASMRMNFDEPDAAPSGALNRILWSEARGYEVQYPGVRRSVFFPMAVELRDEEREDRKD